MTKPHHFTFGIHAVTVLLESSPERIVHICMQKDRRDEKTRQIQNLAVKHGIAIELQSRQALDELTREANHQGVVAICKKPHVLSEYDLSELVASTENPPIFLILDGVQDPHNLGACLRSADAAGVTAVIVPKDNAVGVTPVVSKVACGAVESVPLVQATNLKRVIGKLKDQGCWVYGAAHEADQSLYQADLKGPCAIIMGAEGKGMRRLTKENCDVLLSIPMQGLVSSLNVSVATGIFLFEVQRQRLAAQS